MTAEEADAAQDWRGMDGATAFLLIERHADGWDEIRQMMDAWLRANVAAAVMAEREECAKVCDQQAHEPECPERATYCADAIRARGTP